MATIGHSPREPEAPPLPRPNRSPAGGAAKSPGPRRARRWIAVGAGAVAGLVLLGCSSVWWLASHLDHPWVKPRVVALAHDQAGVDIDYDGLEVSLLSGVRAGSFRVLTPPSLSAGAPELVRIERLELDAPLYALAFGQRSIDALRVGRIHAALVRDENGRTSLDALLPAEAEPANEEPARVSQLLNAVPSLSIEALEITDVSAELVELRGDGSRRVSAIEGLTLSGALRSGDAGLAGTALELKAAPLVLSVTTGSESARATLDTRVALRAGEAQAVSLAVAASQLDARAFEPRASWPGSLLELNATLRTDPGAGRATIALERSNAFGGQLALDTRSELFDESGLRVVTSGAARIALAALPFPVPGVALDGLLLDLSTKELAWDGTRVAGGVDFSGRLASGVLGDAVRGDEALGEPFSDPLGNSVQGARVVGLALSGHGAFQPDGGRFQAALKALALSARSPGASVDVADFSLDASGTTRELAGAQQVDAQATLAVTRARAQATSQSQAAPQEAASRTEAASPAKAASRAKAADQQVELEGARLDATLAGTTRELGAQTIPALDASFSARHIGASTGAQRVSSAGLTLSAVGRQLARDAAAPYGMRGDARVTLAVPTAELADAGTGREGRRPAWSLAGVSASAELPLSLARAAGKLSLAKLAGADGTRVSGLALDLEAEAPLAWGEGGARAHAHGSVAELGVNADSRGALTALDVRVSEAERGRYRLELDATGASLAVGGVRLAGPITATLRGDAGSADGTLKLESTVSGERGAAIELGLDARFERGAERLTYDTRLRAQKLESFAALATAAVPAAARVKLEGARIEATARGDLTGVLRAREGELPELAERPLGAARGSQSARFELHGLDYRGADGALRVPSLALEIESTHRAEAGGTASARLRLPELGFEGGGRSLRLGGVDQAIVASFERAPDQGMVDVDTALSIDSAAQSWLPGLPVRGLRLSSNLQIDRLRSIFLRELMLDNSASGSALRAAGTLELLAQGSPAGDKTIVGREALSFEGRLTQQLPPLEALDVAKHASGAIELPFRLESGGLLGYRLVAALEAKQVSFAAKDDSFAVEQLNGVVPVVEEFALLESGPVISAGPRTSPLSDTRFFDVHPFLSGSDYVTAQSVRFGGLAPLGPIAANVRVERSDFVIDQLQAGYQGGQIVGQVRAAWREGDPIVRLRLNATGVQSGKSHDVFDANTALTFVPAAMTLDGKMQIVRASREHLDDILDVLDPFHESANANRVRQGLALGYPKFVRFHLHDGAVDTKVELGGLAQLVRIDEIRAVPLGPILQKYVTPALAPVFQPGAQSAPAPASPEVPVASAESGEGPPPEPRVAR
ncbi:MAG TPA: hypothetical protein VMG12_15525 [Polyangiaceae bacterium]|nr:hypothetical protein [Polyangiaceae bacterium]